MYRVLGPSANLMRRRELNQSAQSNRAHAKPRAGRRQRAYAAPSSTGVVAARLGALRDLTRRICLSAVSAANAASYATGQETEQRRAA